MTYHVLAVTLVLFIVGADNAANGQTPKGPRVVVAVAPNYFPTALSSHASGEAVVAVRIGSDGSVTSAKAISGNAILVAGSAQVAKRWKFSPVMDKSVVRAVRLIFVYHLVPRNMLVSDQETIFKPPYRVEISHTLPDETPLP